MEGGGLGSFGGPDWTVALRGQRLAAQRGSRVLLVFPELPQQGHSPSPHLAAPSGAVLCSVFACFTGGKLASLTLNS